MIEVRQLVKKYGRDPVLDSVSLSVAAGECRVLTGDNGSGKTTLLHVLIGLRRVDEGRILWDGKDLTRADQRTWQNARRAWGFLPQQAVVPLRSSVSHLLRFHARLRGARPEQARDWLKRVGLADRENEDVGTLSGGMRQRLAIALTLFHEPKLIVMDEPSANLDPAWRHSLTGWLRDAANRGAAVLVSSQLYEAWGPDARYCRCESGRIVEESQQGEGTP